MIVPQTLPLQRAAATEEAVAPPGVLGSADGMGDRRAGGAGTGASPEPGVKALSAGSGNLVYIYGLVQGTSAAAASPPGAETPGGQTPGAETPRARTPGARSLCANPPGAKSLGANAWGANPWGEGVAGGVVRLLPAGPLTALVSDVPPGPIAQTRRNIAAHAGVLERAIGWTDVLPLRFGTVAPDVAVFFHCIAANANGFNSAFRDIDGRVELGLKASWRDGVVYGEIIAADAELCRLRDRLRSRPASETYHERVELGRRVEAALAGRRLRETASIMAGLAPLAERYTGLHIPDENMILNHAFLVRREHEAAFDAKVRAIAAPLENRITFRYVGPVPPYNFVRLQPNWLTGAA
jgi:hypothetical protein